MNDDDEIALMWARLLLGAAGVVLTMLLAALFVIHAVIPTAVYMISVAWCETYVAVC